MCRRLWLVILLAFIPAAFPNQKTTKDDEINDVTVEITDLAKEFDARLLLFSTLDGSLFAIEQETGKVRWTIKDESIITVPKESPDALIPAFLPDPRDGSLYVVTPGKERLKKLSFTIPELVSSSPCRSSDGILYTGKKKDTWFSVNPKTGYREHVLGWDILGTSTCPVQTNDAIFIGRTEYSIKMVDTKQPSRKWNVTFHEYSSASITKEMLADYELVHFTSSCSGNLLTLDRIRGSLLWNINLGSPVVGAYILDPDGLISIPFTSLSNQTINGFIDNLIEFPLSMQENPLKLYPTLYVGEHSNGLYALPSFVDQSQVTIANSNGLPLLLEGPDSDRMPQLYIEYPLPGQEYPLPTDRVMDSVTFQSLPDPNKYTVIYLGHYDLPHYSSTKFLPGSNKVIRLLTDESVPSAIEKSEAEHESPIVKLLKISATLLAVLSIIILTAVKNRNRKKQPPVETVDGCIKIGKITFNKSEVLGKGCEGTFVYRGEFEGRRVAVKRLIPECFEFATREVEMLRESDAHPNVVRYFCMEEDRQFHYIALELCQATVADYVLDQRKPEWSRIDKLDILLQATRGLNHLHNLKIIHRDIKPQNVLLSAPGPSGHVKAMISDFGLSRKLAVNRTSMSFRSGYVGTEGWIAPEMVNGDESITRAVDLFSLGCLFYYVLSDGAHPFGETFSRQNNIKKGRYELDGIVSSRNSVEVYKPLLKKLLEQRPQERPDCETVLGFPMFWSDFTVLAFLQDVSDRVEKSDSNDPTLLALETKAEFVVRGDWRVHIDEEVSSDLRKYRSYRGNSLRDLLRALRNKKHHYHELAQEAQQKLGSIPKDFTRYWISRFPLLLIHTWTLMHILCSETNFQQYYLTNYKFSADLVNYDAYTADTETYKVTDESVLETVWGKSNQKAKSNRSEGLYRNLRGNDVPSSQTTSNETPNSPSKQLKYYSNGKFSNKFNKFNKYKVNNSNANNKKDVPLNWALDSTTKQK